MRGEVRKQLLIKMEKIIGSNCFNGNIQDWGPNGQWLGEGRSFRYPLRFNNIGYKRVMANDIFIGDLMAGQYAFGANRLYFIKVLDEILSMLKKRLRPKDKREKQKIEGKRRSEVRMSILLKESS